MRFVQRNWRCCICRAFCPTVVVTKQAAMGGGGGEQQHDGTAFPGPPLAAGGAGKVGMALSYHNGMAAHFDDQGQYDRVRKKCLVDSAQNRRHASQDSPTDSLILLRIGVAVITLIGLGTGVPIAMHVAQNWNMRNTHCGRLRPSLRCCWIRLFEVYLNKSRTMTHLYYYVFVTSRNIRLVQNQKRKYLFELRIVNM
jgi:hypothetical protein